MKVLTSFTTLLLLSSLSIASEVKGDALEAYLSGLKLQEFGHDYDKAEAESNKLHNTWIQPVQISYSYSQSNSYDQEQIRESAALSISQPVFQSGGIYFAMKFADFTREHSNLSIDQQKRSLIKQTVELLMQIKQNEMKIAKQKLQIANSTINLEQKRELYLNGQLDSGFLNNAIIEKNAVTQTLFDLETILARQISSFEALSDLDYKTASIPSLKMINENEYLKHNIVLQTTQSEIQKNDYNTRVTRSKYLPAVSLTGGYSWDKTQNLNFGGQAGFTPPETAYYNYGLQASIPIDINTFNDIESARADYLKSRVVILDQKRELKALFFQVMLNMKNFDKKIALANENAQLYKTLLSETQTLFEAGYKTAYDVENLSNSFEIQNIDVAVFEIDKQLELLTLYEKFVNEI